MSGEGQDDGHPSVRRDRTFYEAIVESGADLIFVFDPSGALLYVSPSSVAAIGYTPAELGPTLRADLAHPDDLPGWRAAARACIAREPGAGSYTGRLRCKDGTYRVMACHFTNLLQDPAVAAVLCSMRDITATRDFENGFRELAADADDILGLYDVSGTTKFVSPAARDLLGVEPATLVGKHCAEWGFVSGSQLHEMVDAAVDGRRVSEHVPVTAADGQDRWFDLTITPVLDPVTGSVAALQSVARDVTRSRETVDQLAASEARFRLLFNAAPVGVALVDADLTILESNATLERMLGAQRVDPLSGTPVAQLLHPDDVPVLGELDALDEPGSSCELQLRYWSGASWRWARAATSLLEGDGRDRQLLVHLQDYDAQYHLEAALRHAATHDELTGLPNRSALTLALDQLVEAGGPISVLFCDLDGFKRVNDWLGHEAGDVVLVEVARRLRQLAPGGVVGRLSGDEFIIGVSGQDGADLAEQVIRAVTRPITIGGRRAVVGVAIGVAAGTGRPGEEMLQAADVALQEAKRQPGSRYVIADEQLTTAARGRAQMGVEMRAGLPRGEFTLRYQPMFRLADGTIAACEALVRWDHPREGLLRPCQFLDVAESTGLIEQLGQFVLEQACRDARTWPVPVPVAVNVAAGQLGRFADVVSAALAASGLPKSRLLLEVTESSLLNAVPDAWDDLHALADAGLALAVDDFGTGFAPLTHLKDVPASMVKIDQRFITGLETDPLDAAIVSAVVMMAHGAGCVTVAEGVNTARQVQLLTEFGCEYGQGFALSPVLTNEHLMDLFKSPHPAPLLPVPASRAGR